MSVKTHSSLKRLYEWNYERLEQLESWEPFSFTFHPLRIPCPLRPYFFKRYYVSLPLEFRLHDDPFGYYWYPTTPERYRAWRRFSLVETRWAWEVRGDVALYQARSTIQTRDGDHLHFYLYCPEKQGMHRFWLAPQRKELIYHWFYKSPPPILIELISDSCDDG